MVPCPIMPLSLPQRWRRGVLTLGTAGARHTARTGAAAGAPNFSTHGTGAGAQNCAPKMPMLQSGSSAAGAGLGGPPYAPCAAGSAVDGESLEPGHIAELEDACARQTRRCEEPERALSSYAMPARPLGSHMPMFLLKAPDRILEHIPSAHGTAPNARGNACGAKSSRGRLPGTFPWWLLLSSPEVPRRA